MSIGGLRTKRRTNIAENFSRTGREHERYRQTTDGRAMTHIRSRSLKTLQFIAPFNDDIRQLADLKQQISQKMI